MSFDMAEILRYFTALYISFFLYGKAVLYIRLSHYGKTGVQYYFDKNIRSMCLIEISGL